MIPVCKLSLHGLYGLYGPRCLLSAKRLFNLITHSLTSGTVQIFIMTCGSSKVVILMTSSVQWSSWYHHHCNDKYDHINLLYKVHVSVVHSTPCHFCPIECCNISIAEIPPNQLGSDGISAHIKQRTALIRYKLRFWFNITNLSYQYENFLYGGKTVIHNQIFKLYCMLGPSHWKIFPIAIHIWWKFSFYCIFIYHYVAWKLCAFQGSTAAMSHAKFHIDQCIIIWIRAKLDFWCIWIKH